jgi:hypothetical protein
MRVLLTDGVAETELAAAFRPYTELSYLARPLGGQDPPVPGHRPAAVRPGLALDPDPRARS